MTSPARASARRASGPCNGQYHFNENDGPWIDLLNPGSPAGDCPDCGWPKKRPARAFASNAIVFTLIGEAASKANSRKMAMVGPADKRRMLFIKADKALSFERSALYQIPQWARKQLEGPICVTMRIFYASERPDLDESLVLDILQDRWQRVEGQRVLVQKGVYRNDRQVREKHIYHRIDRNNPRVEIIVEPLLAQQESLL
jgi:Holliday junction resolvase RusA-like endonuclease